MNFAKFLRTPFFREQLCCLLLKVNTFLKKQLLQERSQKKLIFESKTKLLSLRSYEKNLNVYPAKLQFPKYD